MAKETVARSGAGCAIVDLTPEHAPGASPRPWLEPHRLRTPRHWWTQLQHRPVPVRVGGPDEPVRPPGPLSEHPRRLCRRLCREVDGIGALCGASHGLDPLVAGGGHRTPPFGDGPCASGGTAAPARWRWGGANTPCATGRFNRRRWARRGGPGACQEPLSGDRADATGSRCWPRDLPGVRPRHRGSDSFPKQPLSGGVSRPAAAAQGLRRQPAVVASGLNAGKGGRKIRRGAKRPDAPSGRLRG